MGNITLSDGEWKIMKLLWASPSLSYSVALRLGNCGGLLYNRKCYIQQTALQKSQAV